ncbi:MAG TPA: sigma-70 family RNA polymerase sigma factor [Pirellulales bacterium]|nr:sigma-70 family RNA polymerase sigma factor [Pirellulales bacterium]
MAVLSPLNHDRAALAVIPTSVSLLERLRLAEPDDPHWRRLHDIYEPWILGWLARVPELGTESHDVAQEVLMVVVKELPNFNRQRDGSFRRWLGNVVVNRLRSHWKRLKRRPSLGLDDAAGAEFVEQLADPASALSREWDRQHDQFVLDRLMTTVRADFSETTWEAFRRCALDGETTAAVAADLGITINAVLMAKSRVLKRLREEAAGLVD